MTAPGNSALLITLLAVFVACFAYAAGRLHQRYQMERDREEAYRDGYDTATRSVFSLAARVIAPRRGVRAAVPALPAVSPDPAATGGAATPAAAAASGGPAGPPAVGSLSAAPGGSGVAAGSVLGGSVAGGSAVPPGFAAVSGASAAPGGLVVPAGLAEQVTPSVVRPVPGISGLLRRSAVPGTTATPLPEAADGAVSLGFPAPPPPPPRTIPEAAAVGGVVYQPFPGPRPAPAAPPAAAADGSAAAASAPSADSSSAASSADSPSASAASPASAPPSADAGSPSGSSGRHTVPDELVQAATYRLPPDRIFRAKVRDANLPDEPTTRLSVPKPRQS